MSVRVSSWVWEHSDVTHRGDLLVLLALADHAHDDGASAYPSVDTLARKARLTRRGAQLALRRLEKVGAITAEGKGPRGTTAYRIHMQGANSVRSEGTSRGELSDTRGANTASPEPSFEPSNPSLSVFVVKGRGRERGELAELLPQLKRVAA